MKGWRFESYRHALAARGIRTGRHVYSKEDGKSILRFLKRHGIKAELMGTLPSNHDIDIVVDDDLINKTMRLLEAKKKVHTDLGSVFILSQKYGHVDIFPISETMEDE